MRPEYREGKEAREQFDKGMAKLFQAKKSVAVKQPSKPVAKPKKRSKG